jgi:hypothetical protein
MCDAGDRGKRAQNPLVLWQVVAINLLPDAEESDVQS